MGGVAQKRTLSALPDVKPLRCALVRILYSRYALTL